MNTINKTFLTILKAALQGAPYRDDPGISPEDWQTLFAMAGIHKVLPLFYDAVYTCPAFQQLEPTIAPMMKHQVRQQVLLQTLRTQEFLELQKALRNAGVTSLVVKGIICRNLYPKPDARQSSDEDVLIPQEQAEACHRVMTEFGMYPAAGQADFSEYEIPYRKKESPLYIELHQSLFPPESEAYGDLNRFFEDAFSRAVEVPIQDTTVATLGYTDHLFYLICHAFKHFLHSGFGIRQVCDIVLFANRYGHQVDWTKILASCREIRAHKFAAALFRIGQEYLVFDPDQAAYPQSWRDIQVDEVPMLEDLLSGGIYGDATMSRKHSSNITLDAVAAQKQGIKAKGSFAASVFPSAAKLSGRYPYLEKRPYLLPVAWSHRILTFAKETRQRRDSQAGEALKIGNHRLQLMKTYDILQ